MGIKENVENHPGVWFFSVLLSGFVLGVGAYQGVLKIGKLEVVSGSKLEQLRATAAGCANKPADENSAPSSTDNPSPKQDSETLKQADQGPTPVKQSDITPKEYVENKNGFQFSFVGGSYQDRKLKLNITVVSKNQDRTLWFTHETRLIDDKGHVYNPTHSTLGTRQKSSGGMSYDCPADVPVAMTIEFENLSSDVVRFNLLELDLNNFKLSIAGDNVFRQPAMATNRQ